MRSSGKWDDLRRRVESCAGLGESARVNRLFLTLLCCLAATTLFAQEYKGRVLVQPTLLADTTAIVPGQPFEVGLLLEMAPGWHTYWENAGDAGLPTTIHWTLPEGFAAGPIQWPLPRRIVEPGDIQVYAYKDKVLLITTIVPPADFVEASVTLRAKAAWLVCEEICIPGTAELELTLPVGGEAAPDHKEVFAEARAHLPSADPVPYDVTWKKSAESLSLTVRGVPDSATVEFFPLPLPDQQVGHAVNSPVKDGVATVEIPAAGDLRGILTVELPEGRRGWFVLSDQRAGSVDSKIPSNSESRSVGDNAPYQLIRALLFGFLGGLILNLMPCVLPVISLKIFGFVRQAGEDPRKILGHGLAFVGGIFLWFLGLGLLIVALKAAGNEVTWAFQFQNPWFNVAISSIVFVFALNLFGVFEIVLPGQASNSLAEASAREGYAGSFAQGIFATLLATPCTAPFLGTALGFAFAQSAGVILAMFASIAFGMGLPYLLLSAKPGWMKILPKPGAWMERMKQFMGFPLMATLLWLLFVLGNQKGLDAVIWVGGFLLCLALACWIYGAFCGPLSSSRTRGFSLLLIVAIVTWGSWFFLAEKFPTSQRPAAGAVEKSGGIDWKPFSQKSLDALLAEGRPVFLDFTADWCISCKFNERTAIDVPAVREAFQKDGIVPMKADWTNANPEITAALKKFGRVGVPFYVIYPAGRADEPIILPEILTEQIVLAALARARG